MSANDTQKKRRAEMEEPLIRTLEEQIAEKIKNYRVVP